MFQNVPVGSGPVQPKRRSLSAILVFLLAVVMFSLGARYGHGDLFKRSSSQNSTLARLDYTGTDEIFRELKQNFDGKLDQTSLEDGLKEGLTKAAGDPYTEYLNAKEAKNFQNDLDGSFTGIGAELSKDAQTKSIVVVAPLSGYPAEKAGLKPKDVIAEIDGKSAYDITVSEAVDKIRGPKDTKVKLKVVRNERETLDFEITRQEIKIPSVETKTLDNNIGYIKISRFADDTADLTQKAAKTLKEQQVKGVVLDLRGDPGGLLDAAVSVSSLWLKDKTILTERRDGTIVKTFKSAGDSLLEGVPTVVLIDEGSASASEITAGALHDNKAAQLVGVKSFGKGSVQQLQQLSSGGVLKVTVARWYTPSGKNIDKAGIEPDKKVERSEDDLKNNQDPQLQAAQDILSE